MNTQPRHPARSDIDQTALLRDDVLVDALAKGVLPMEYRDDELIRALLTWRDDIQATPFKPSPALARAPEAALATFDPTPHHDRELHGDQLDELEPAGRWRWFKRPVLLSGALAAVVLGSLGSVAAANVAEPGSALWPLSKVVNKDRAQSLEAREDARDKLRDAKVALKQDDAQNALAQLEQAQAQAAAVRDQDGKSDLEQELQQVKAQLEQPSASPSPHEPTPSPSSPTPSTSPSVTPSPSPSTTATPSSSSSPTPSDTKPTASPK